MAFTQLVPNYTAEGTAMPDSKMEEGFHAGEKPPANWFNWLFNNYSLSIKELQNNAIHKEEKGAANGVATLGSNGKVPSEQLDVFSGDYNDLINKPFIPSVIDSYTSTDQTNAPSAYALKLVNDKITGHAGNTTIHVTQEEKNRWNNTSVADASLTQKGVVQLTNDITTSESLAITPNGVKALKDQFDYHKADMTLHMTATEKSRVAAIGDPDELTTTSDEIVGSINELNAKIGPLSDLTTTSKDNVVNAINTLQNSNSDLETLLWMGAI